MSHTLSIRCYRSAGPRDPGRFQEYQVPLERETSLQDLLQYIVGRIDPTLAFYQHAACRQGLCGECRIRVNGKAALACTTPVSADSAVLVLEPIDRERVARDLLCNPRDA